MTQRLEIAIAAGGTAGHINPALALAEELASRGHHVTFYGQEAKLEGRLVPEAGFDFFPIVVTGVDRSRPWTALRAVRLERRATTQISRHFSDAGVPSVGVGFGAYVELPLVDACRARGVPIVLHEQNSVPGLANKLSAKKACRVCISVPAAASVFEGRTAPGGEVVLTGNPVRSSVTRGSREHGRANAGVGTSDRFLLIFGGSLGAQHLNSAVVALRDELLSRPDLHIVQSTGEKDFDRVTGELGLTAEEASRWKVAPYLDDMGDLLAAADLVVSRAGASSIAEIAALDVPSLLVPYPFATADHQTTNARYLVDAGAAELVSDSDLDAPVFRDRLCALLDDAELRARMRASAAGLASSSAAAALADQVELVAG